MNPQRAFSVEDSVRAAEVALTHSAGEPAAIRDVQSLSDEQRRNLILRASAIGRDGSAKPIIIKATRAANYDPAAEDAYERFGLAKEWAAATLLAQRAHKHRRHSTFLAADVRRGVIVFEDLGGLQSLAQTLLHGSVPEAEKALTAYALALAQLHTETLNPQTEHEEIVRRAFPNARVAQPGRPGAVPLGHDWLDQVSQMVPSLLGGSLPEREVAIVAKHMRRPGPWLVLAHADPCPDNVLLTAPGRAELIDFEFAAPGHALIDATYWRMGFPTCWCAGDLPNAVADRLDQTYRVALAESLPLAANYEAFRRESAIVSVAWMLASLGWILERALKEDVTWGISTLRSRILFYLERAVEIAAHEDELAGIAKAIQLWLATLRDCWPAIAPLAVYPAFRNS
jgi:thiamine kinase-like enzyme